MTAPTQATDPLDAPSQLDAPSGAAPVAVATHMFGRTVRLLAAAVTLAVVALVAGTGAQSASAQPTSNAFGTLKPAKVSGHAAHGATFAGRYHVTRFVTRHHKVRAVGRLTGTLTRKSGATRHVAERVRMPLNVRATRAANAPVPPVVPAPTAQSAAAAPPVSCEVLNLVLGPLDLNLLGLVVHLDRVVLNITAVPGAGALLGNLLCALVGILDGTGLGGLNGILTNLLNAILGILQA